MLHIQDLIKVASDGDYHWIELIVSLDKKSMEIQNLTEEIKELERQNDTLKKELQIREQ